VVISTGRNIYEEIWFSLFEAPKIDTHEHLLPQQTFLQSADILFEILNKSYLPWICFGARDLGELSWDKRLLIEKMQDIPASSSLKYLQRGFQFMYGFSGSLLHNEHWQELESKIRKAYSENNMVKKWLQEKLRVKKIVLDRYWVVNDFDLEKSIFSPVLRIDPYLYGFSAHAKDHDGKNPYSSEVRKGKEIITFEDYLALIDQRIEKALKEGVVAIKCAIAYDRNLDFNLTTPEKARKALETEDGKETPQEIFDFQNFIFHYFLQKAVEYDLPIQIHTGPGKAFQGAPQRLGPIMEKYTSLKISFLHGGFPWIGEPGAMAYFYPNLYLDYTWLPVLSPTFSDLTLTQWLEVTGGSRIMMGGDSWNTEGAVGSLLFNLDSLTRVLTKMIVKNYLSKAEALQIGKRILWENPLKFFGKRLKTKT